MSIPNLDDDDFEFIELANTDDSRSLNLLGMQFVNGIEYVLPDYSLGPGQRAVIVKNIEAFTLRYDDTVDIIGEWTSGSLSNSGEQLELVDGTGERLLNIEYDDGDLWPIGADGAGATLTWIGDYAETTSPGDKYYSWTTSNKYGGSPGNTEPLPPTIVINELQSNAPLDRIELFNFGNQPINIGGWYLSDSRNDLKRFQIPMGVTLDPDGYLVFDENQLGFGLNARGEEAWLTRSDGIGLAIVDAIEFGAAMENTSLGRIQNGTGRLIANSRPSFGCHNRGWEANEVVISEIYYHPSAPGLATTILDPTLMAQDLEFVEVTNQSDRSINLFASGITGGIEFAFPPGSRIEPAESLVLVSFDPSDPAFANRLIAFQIETAMPADVHVYGPFQGRLNNGGEALRLYMPDPNASGAPVVVDEVVYDDLTPWDGDADGNGFSLQRQSGISAGNQSRNWVGAPPSAGLAGLESPVIGDFNGDSQVDARDIDLLFDIVDSGRYLGEADLNGDLSLSMADVTFLIENVIGKLMGDANLDRVVDVSDFNLWNENRFGMCRGWALGDLNGDTRVDVADFNIWNTNKFRLADRATAFQTTLEYVFESSADEEEEGWKRSRSDVLTILLT